MIDKLCALWILLAVTALAACSGDSSPLATEQIIVTSEAGQKLETIANVDFQRGEATGIVVRVDPAVRKQTITGIGSSFTESSAFVLAHLDEDARRDVMLRAFSDEGANFSLARTTIGSTDFSVEGKFSYAPLADDAELESFSISVDRDGFSKQQYPGIRDESYDLLPMIHEALAIKQRQDDSTLNIVASAWTAPPWMKDIEDWYIGGTPDNYGQGTGGELKPQYVQTYADYLLRYLDAYAEAGVDVWGLTPVNEPHGNSGQWESMHFTPETQADFIADHLGPTLAASNHSDVRILTYDQNRDALKDWVDVVLADPDAAQYIYGTALHWYGSTTRVFEEVLQDVHRRFPEFDMINTEATIDNLGLAAPAGVTDPEGYQESGWFMNDAFWWNPNASDWAYAATWAPNAEDHPLYTPVHRYARNIIVSLDNWVSGWIDWNVVLDHIGGPNHVGNFCGAPIMINTETNEIYYTPVYHVLSQFSRTIRPGDVVVGTTKALNGLDDDTLHAVSTINDDNLLTVQLLNTSKKPLDVNLQIGDQFAVIPVSANAVQTVRVQLAQ